MRAAFAARRQARSGIRDNEVTTMKHAIDQRGKPQPWGKRPASAGRSLVAAHALQAGLPGMSGRRDPLRLSRMALSMAAALGVGLTMPAARAGNVFNCAGAGQSGWFSAIAGSGNGAWTNGVSGGGADSCNGGTGITIQENNGTGGVGAGQAYVWVGQTGYNAAGSVTLYGPSGINLQGTTSLNGNKITKLQQGVLSASSMDAVNGAQLYQTNQNVAALAASLSSSQMHFVSIDGDAQQGNYGSNGASGYHAIAIGPNALAGGKQAVALGDGANAGNEASVAIGRAASASGFNQGVAIGASNTTDGGVKPADPKQGGGLVAIGQQNTARTLNSDPFSGGGIVALGQGNTAQGQGAVAIGHANMATAAGAIAVGDTAMAMQAGGIALGVNARAARANDVALGAGSVTSAPNPFASIVLGGMTYGFAGGNPASVVSVGAPGAERQITNVAAGQLSGNSTDAVNGSQLYAAMRAINTLSTSTQTSIVNLTNQVGSLSTGLSVTNGNVSTLSSSLSTTNNNVATLSTTVQKLGNTTAAVADMRGDGSDKPAVTPGSNSAVIGARSNDDGRSNVVSVGNATQQRQITNVAAGTEPTDAVNVDQLNQGMRQGVSQANRYTDQRIDAVSQSLHDLAKGAYGGIAAALAMPNLTPSGPGRTVVAVGMANYKSGNAAAVSATYRSENSRWLVNAGFATTNSGDRGVRAQLGYEW
ncbi:hypothetical protein WS67_01235 [Burkholderia singularis]|uniref:Uncharacterized protein n=2 Tax=Burkholderia singularis TaxID=1503053 RepID=A0A103DWU2_9BURK|nr:hypothetical protein WS67_01235 [Burkholderia singularis]